MLKLKKGFFASASMLVFWGLVLNTTPIWGADSPVGTILLNNDFEANVVGSKPAGWGVHNDEGNDAVIVDTPAIGKRSVKLTDTGGTVWNPSLYGWLSGEENNSLQLDLDWHLNSTVDSNDKALAVFYWQGAPYQQKFPVFVALGGPGGVSIKQNGKWLDLHVPIKTNQWNHLTIISDPISYGFKGKIDLIVIQGDKKALFENLPFNEPITSYNYSPSFSLGCGDVAGMGKEAYIDNVQLKVINKKRSAPQN